MSITAASSPSAAMPQHQSSWLRRLAGPITRPARQKAWDWSVVFRHGWPRTVIVYGHGFGDHLLCTAIFHELRKRGQRGLWMMCDHPELFEGNSDVDAVVPMSWRYPDLAQRLGGRSIFPDYATIVQAEDRSTPPDKHIIAKMCQHADITGQIELRPYLWLTDQEKAAGRIAPRQIAIQSSILSASLPIRNKEWHAGRFAAVIAALSPEYTFVQVGMKSDPKLEGAVDRRGKTDVRQTAAILSQSLVFVGLVGFLMHLARAVECRSVIVFGGREAPWQSGYGCNENLYSAMPCAPCWLWSKCDFGHQCMNRIEASQVIEAVDRQIKRAGLPLAADVETLNQEERI